MKPSTTWHQLVRLPAALAAATLAAWAPNPAIAGPGISPAYSANAAPPPAAPDTFANTYYANSPQGPRPDLVGGATYANGVITGPTINTGTAMRKFVDILPSVPGLAPTTNAGKGVTGGAAKYMPLAAAGSWSDGADYYHIAIVEYTEQMHADLPKATTLRGYVQIEEPGQTAPAATVSKHIALKYPNGSPITLPDVNGVQQQVYAYDNPHYLGPIIAAVKGKPIRVKYSNLLPVGDASGKDQLGNPLGNGVANRNGDLFIPVDATLAGGAMPQNRAEVHLHGGLTPWISDGTPHQWTIPVGDTRHGYLSDLAVIAQGSAYDAATRLVIDPPQSVASGLSANVAGGRLTNINVKWGGAGYTTATAAPTISAPPPGTPAAGTATGFGALRALTGITVATAGTGYATAPTVTIAAPPAAVQAVPGGVTIGTGATAHRVTAIATGTAGFGYWAAPAVTLSAPPAATQATGTATVSAANGAITALAANSAANFGYFTAPVVSIAPPPPAVQATSTATVATGGVSGLSINATNLGYWTAPAVTIAPPPAAIRGTVTAALTVGTGAISTLTVGTVGNGYATAPAVTVSAPTGTATQATTTSSNLLRPVGTHAVAIANPGAGYLAAPVVTVTGTGGAATGTATVSAAGLVTSVSITVTRAFTANPTVTLAAPPPKRTAVVTATVAGNLITGYTLTNAGSGYTAAPTLTVAAPNATNTPATATATVANGVLTGFTITNRGTGYIAAPAVTIGAPTAGVRAVATAVVNAATGVLTGFTLTTAGSGYNNPPIVTIAAPTPSATATATATVNAATGVVTGYTVTNGGANYLAAPTVTVGAPTTSVTATANATINAAGAVTGFTLTNRGTNYVALPVVTVSAPPAGVAATATANLDANGTILGYTITNRGSGYSTAPTVTVGWPAGAVQATATPAVTGGLLSGATITNPGGGYLSTPNVQVVDGTGCVTIPATDNTPAITTCATGGAGGSVSALIQTPVGASFRHVPDMTGTNTVTAGGVAAVTVPPPVTGEGTLYWTNAQTERFMFYHDHTSGTTRLNVYTGEAAGYVLIDPKVDPALPIPSTAATGTGALQGYIPEEQIPLVFQDRTFVPQDVLQQDSNWDTTHWGQPGDLWWPHVYETNQNPAFLRSLSNLGRWDWGPWFAIVYPALYALPTGKYGDVTTTPEAYMDTAVVNGTAYPTLTVEPRAYRLRILNAANDRFLNLGFYLADTTRPGPNGTFTEVKEVANIGDQPGTLAGAAPNVFQQTANTTLLPWPTDGRIAPAPDTMGPPMIQFGNEAGLLPQWVQHDPVPVNYDYNRRSVTVLNVAQNNDLTQVCFPECHGLYIGPAERADVVVDFAPYAGKTLILYNDSPAPNPGYDTRIDYYTGNDPTDSVNYVNGGAHNTVAGYGPNTRTVMQVVVGSVQNVGGTNPIDYTKSAYVGANGLQWFDPTRMGSGRVLSALTSATPGLIQQVYSATQEAPIIGESAYNIAFNPTTSAANAAAGSLAGGKATSTGGYIDQYGNMYLASQNQPEFYATNPGPLTITSIQVTGNTSSTGSAGGIGTGGTGGTNAGAGSGTGYTTAPAVVISAPTACTVNGTTCANATATATVSGGQVTAVTLTNPGAGYTEVPSVTFVSGGSVSATSVTAGGSNYTSAAPPAVTFSAPTACTLNATSCVTATGTAVVSAAGVVTGITITNAGAGYTSAPTVAIGAPATVVAPTLTASLSAGGVSSIAVTTAGSGYVTAPTLTVAPPPVLAADKPVAALSASARGRLASITPAVSSATVNSGYVSAPSVVVAAPPAAVAATGSATVAGGAVTAITVTNPAGVNYFGVAPTVTIGAPISATPAVIQPIITSVGVSPATLYYVTGFTIVNAGSGYASAPYIVTACGATGNTTISASGAINGVVLTALGSGSCASTPAAETLALTTVSTNVLATGQASPATPTAGVQATATATLDATGTTVASVTLAGGSAYAVATPPTVTFSAPASAQAVATATVTGGVVTGYTLTNAGAGYAAVPAVTVSGGGGTPATATAALGAGGAIASVTVTSAGSGYTTAPAVTVAGGAGGAQATAVAAVSGGGYGATAVAVASTTQVFIAPAALPTANVPPTANTVPLTLTAGVQALLGCSTNNPATAVCTNLNGAVVGRLMNPAIQELFEPFYGRMNATLGVEMPLQSLTTQTTVPLNYIDAPTDFWEPGKPVMWKITHNGVDAHPVHFHLLNVQVVNRVGWDGTVKAPEDDEIGWKETVKMNPLEDIIVVMRPAQPSVPFGLDRSVRPDDPSQPVGVNTGFTQVSTNGWNGQFGAQLSNQALLGALPSGDSVSNNGFAPFAARDAAGNVLTSPSSAWISAAGIAAGVGGTTGGANGNYLVNGISNFDNEYVWHCHILGHEENDFMRGVSLLTSPVAPAAPAGLSATQAAAGATVALAWTDTTPLATSYGSATNELGYLVQRSVDGVNWTTVARVAANHTTAVDPNVPVTGATYSYKVVAFNAAGASASTVALTGK